MKNNKHKEKEQARACSFYIRICTSNFDFSGSLRWTQRKPPLCKWEPLFLAVRHPKTVGADVPGSPPTWSPSNLYDYGSPRTSTPTRKDNASNYTRRAGVHSRRIVEFILLPRRHRVGFPKVSVRASGVPSKAPPYDAKRKWTKICSRHLPYKSQFTVQI